MNFGRPNHSSCKYIEYQYVKIGPVIYFLTGPLISLLLIICIHLCEGLCEFFQAGPSYRILPMPVIVLQQRIVP